MRTTTSSATPRAGRCAWLRAGRRPRSSMAPRRSTHVAACRKSKAGWPSRRRSGCDRSPCAESTRRSSGHALPVRVESVADVKLAGSCEFSMWIDYTAVDGIRVDRAATRPSLLRVRAVAPADCAELTAEADAASAASMSDRLGSRTTNATRSPSAGSTSEHAAVELDELLARASPKSNGRLLAAGVVSAGLRSKAAWSGIAPPPTMRSRPGPPSTSTVTSTL